MFPNAKNMLTLQRSKITPATMNRKQEKKVKQAKKLPKIKEKRIHSVRFMLNDTEHKAIERHLKKYKITNKASWYRRTILAHLWQKLGEDYPMLFEEKEMQQENMEVVKVKETPTLFDEQEMQQGTLLKQTFEE